MFNNDSGKMQHRLQSLFDGVVAVSLTMMALTINVSDFTLSFHDPGLLQFFNDFTAYLISFIAIGVLWYMHSQFFDVYDYAGDKLEVFMHLALMFVMTIFPVLTQAMSKGSHWGIRVLYILVYYVMNLLNLAIISHATKASQNAAIGQQIMAEMIAKSLPEDKGRDAMNMISAINSMKGAAAEGEATGRLADGIFSKFKDSELGKMLDSYNKKKEHQFRYYQAVSIMMLIYTFMAVIGLMFGTLICYIIMIVGACACVLAQSILARGEAEG